MWDFTSVNTVVGGLAQKISVPPNHSNPAAPRGLWLVELPNRLKPDFHWFS